MIVLIRQVAAMVLPVDTSLFPKLPRITLLQSKETRDPFSSVIVRPARHIGLGATTPEGKCPSGTIEPAWHSCICIFLFNIILPRSESNHTPSVHCRISKTYFFRIKGHNCSWDVPPKLQDKVLGNSWDRQHFFWLTRSLWLSGVFGVDTQGW